MAATRGKGTGSGQADFATPVRPRQEWKPSGPERSQEMFLPVSGFIWFYPEEMKVIDHPAFQRLGKVYQLGQAYHVFRGAGAPR